MTDEAAWRRRFRAPRMSLPSWARDEPRRCVYTSNASGHWEVYAWDVARVVHRRVTDRPEGTSTGRIDPSGAQVWWFDDDAGNELGRWVAEPFGGGVRRTVTPDLPAGYGAGLALGRSFAVVGFSREGGSSICLVRDGEAPALLYVHEQEAEVAGLSRDETLVCISHSEHADSRHPALRVLGLDGRPVADLWDGPGLGLWAQGWSPVPGDQRVAVLHERRGLFRPLIWSPVADGTRDIDVDLPGEVGVGWYPDASALLVLHQHRGRSELYRLSLPDGALEPLATGPGTISEARVHPGGEVWCAWTSSSMPQEIRADGRVLVRPPGEPAPVGVAYGDWEVDGIHVFCAEPGSRRPHPAVVLVHGGPSWHDRDEFSPAVQAWVDHGFAVLLVNYRGSLGYGKAWRDAIEGNPGFPELEDIGKVRDWAVDAGIADPGRLVLAGASWGGYLTLLGLGTQPELWSLGIAAVPVADYEAAYSDEMEPLKAFDRALFGGSPDERPGLYRERSPITYVDRVRVPVLILAGANDPRCPIRQIENYVRRLEELGKTHEVYRYEAGHGSLVIEETICQVEAEIAFASRHLGTRAPL